MHQHTDRPTAGGAPTATRQTLATHPAVAALVLDTDLLPLGVTPATEHLDDGLLVRAQALHGLSQRVCVRGGVEAGSGPDSALDLGQRGQVRWAQVASNGVMSWWCLETGG